MKSINEDYFDSNSDNIELYETNILLFNDKYLGNHSIKINIDFHENIPFNHINQIRKILKEIKELDTNSIYYDFINDLALIDHNINTKSDWMDDEKHQKEEEIELKENIEKEFRNKKKKYIKKKKVKNY